MAGTARAVLFDLDGTLVDSLRDIANAMNHVLAAAGFPTHAEDDYRAHVGWGAGDLVRRALPAEARDDVDVDVDVERHLKSFRERYASHLVEATAPYPGIEDALRKLLDRGIPVAVLSNKPEDSTRAVVAKLFGDLAFAEVRGARAEVPHKPDPAALLAVARQLDIAPSQCAYVGDTEIDVQAAIRAGMMPVAVAWGFRPKAAREALAATTGGCVIEVPQQLATLAQAT